MSRLVLYFALIDDIRQLKLKYMQYIRVIPEGSCQVWSGGLTARNKRGLERIQKIALQIIIPSMKYKQALIHFNLEPFELRGKYLTLRFPRKARNHPKFIKYDANTSRYEFTHIIHAETSE